METDLKDCTLFNLAFNRFLNQRERWESNVCERCTLYFITFIAHLFSKKLRAVFTVCLSPILFFQQSGEVG